MARLLFDEPLSEKPCDMLADVFPGSLHIRSLVMVALKTPRFGKSRGLTTVWS